MDDVCNTYYMQVGQQNLGQRCYQVLRSRPFQLGPGVLNSIIASSMNRRSLTLRCLSAG